MKKSKKKNPRNMVGMDGTVFIYKRKNKTTTKQKKHIM